MTLPTSSAINAVHSTDTNLVAACGTLDEAKEILEKKYASEKAVREMTSEKMRKVKVANAFDSQGLQQLKDRHGSSCLSVKEKHDVVDEFLEKQISALLANDRSKAKRAAVGKDNLELAEESTEG
ncbi:hypothetical protein TYRP_003708 [Tyrophagus putrescentiae]|nr:hypothetical protein TYRP_003708 [Tyrophagus putrescentiae]